MCAIGRVISGPSSSKLLSSSRRWICTGRIGRAFGKKPNRVVRSSFRSDARDFSISSRFFDSSTFLDAFTPFSTSLGAVCCLPMLQRSTKMEMKRQLSVFAQSSWTKENVMRLLFCKILIVLEFARGSRRSWFKKRQRAIENPIVGIVFANTSRRNSSGHVVS